MKTNKTIVRLLYVILYQTGLQLYMGGKSYIWSTVALEKLNVHIKAVVK